MNPETTHLSEIIIKMLQDETRLAIYTCLTIYQKLTVKQLATFLHRGKTTINHHLRKLEDEGIVKWEEQEEDRKQLKTRFYSINYENLRKSISILESDKDLSKLSKQENKEIKKSIISLMRTQTSVVENLLNWMIKYSENLPEPVNLQSMYEENESYISTFKHSKYTIPIYQDFLNELIKNTTKEKSDKLPITHISTHILIPIEKIMEWKKKSKD